MRLAKFAGRFALFLTGMALLTVISLFVVGAFLTTWPVHRISPRNQRLTAIMELATALFGTARAFNFTPSPPEATEATEATEEEVTLNPGEWRLSVSEDGEVLTTANGHRYRRIDNEPEGGD